MVQLSRSNERRVLRTVLLGLSTGLAATTGCQSMQSPGSWFSKPTAAESLNGGGQTNSGSFVSSLSAAGQGISGQVKTVGATMGSAMTKAKNLVTAPFTAEAENGDPTSLSNMPTNLGPEIWITNGQLYESQGKHAKAIENYQKALELEPNNEPGLLSMARLHARQQQYAEAEQYYQRALAVRPQGELYNELASCQHQQGRTPEAMATVEKAISLEPNNQRYRNNLASMLVAGGRSEEAVQHLSQVFPPAVAHYNVAYLLFTRQDLPGAQARLQTALQIDPNLKEARDLWAKLNGSPTAQAGIAAYQTANQIYRTAQAAVAPTAPVAATSPVPAATAGGYQIPPGVAQVPMPAASAYPQYPAYPAN